MLDTEKLKDYYDREALTRNGRGIAEWKQIERDRFAASLPENAQRMLEVGSGPGRDAAFFESSKRMEVTCLDFSVGMVAQCKNKNLEAHVCDFTMLPLDFPVECHYDAIYAMNSILHVPKETLNALLQELARLLIPGGLFYVGTYGGEDFEGPWEYDPSGEKRFFSYHSDEALKQALQGSGLFDITYFGTLIPPCARGHESSIYFQSVILSRKPP